MCIYFEGSFIQTETGLDCLLIKCFYAISSPEESILFVVHMLVQSYALPGLLIGDV